VESVRSSRYCAALVFSEESAGDLLVFGPAGPDAARMRDEKTAERAAAEPDMGADGKTTGD